MFSLCLIEAHTVDAMVIWSLVSQIQRLIFVRWIILDRNLLYLHPARDQLATATRMRDVKSGAQSSFDCTRGLLRREE